MTPSPVSVSNQLWARAVLLAVPLLAGNELLAHQITLGPPEMDKVTIIQNYYFQVRAYTPPVPVSPSADEDTLSLDTPEGSALAHYTSILRGDYERFLSNWDETSRQGIIKRNTERGRDDEFWKGIWREAFESYTTCALTRRVDSDAFVIIEFRCLDAEDERDDLVLDLALKEDANGEWRPTNSLASDPVCLYWRNPETPIETLARER